jgi:soluble lytic murein transglycosylase-like protein
MSREKLLPIVNKIAIECGLSPDLVDAIVQVESSYRPEVTRFEPKYKHLYAPDVFAKRHKILLGQECKNQRTSFGLMQIMGGTARWLGFKGIFSELFEPEINIRFGCRYLKKLRFLCTSDDDLIASYNAGSPRRSADGAYVNQSYVDKVRAIYP